MSSSIHVTVAAIAERNGRFLMIEETISNQLRINQPAGHLETGESLHQAVIRETLEETSCVFTPAALIGIYLWKVPNSDLTYLRATFCGKTSEPDPSLQLDAGIERTLWLRRDELIQRESQWRSPLVLRCIDDYLAGRRYPLDLLVSLVGHD